MGEGGAEPHVRDHGLQHLRTPYPHICGPARQAPEELQTAREKKALRAMIKGPKDWASEVDFKLLKRGYSFPSEAHNLYAIAKAAKLRVAVNEAKMSGGLRIEDKHHTLQAARQFSEAGSLANLHTAIWKNWYDNALATVLLENKTNLQESGFTQLTVEKKHFQICEYGRILQNEKHVKAFRRQLPKCSLRQKSTFFQ